MPRPVTPYRLRRALRPGAVGFGPAGVFVLQSRHAPGFSMEPTRHEFLKALLVFSGEGELVLAGGAGLPLRAGDAVVVPAGCEHRLHDRRPLSLYVLCFRREDYAAGYADALGAPDTEPRRLAGEAGRLLDQARRLSHELASARAARESMCRGLAWQFLAELARVREAGSGVDRRATADDPTGSRARVRRAAEDLRHAFYESWSLDEAARRAGLARRRFSELFLEIHGRTWRAALLAARLDHAETLLRDPRRSVAAAAFECGFGDLSAFYRAWHARHREGPQAWRRARARELVP